MIGVLGKYFLGKRIFETIITLRKLKRIGDKVVNESYVRLLDYIDYIDMLYNGT